MCPLSYKNNLILSFQQLSEESITVIHTLKIKYCFKKLRDFHKVTYIRLEEMNQNIFSYRNLQLPTLKNI